jgi:hypothetical protein
VIAGSAAVAAMVALAVMNRVPWLAAAMIALILARGIYGLSPYRRPAQPRTIGLQEMALGFVTVVVVAIGYALGV